jgi:YesN/AraC family two-component response regulator
MLVDDREMVRNGLIELLAGFEDIVIVAQANDGMYAVSICQQYHPDVVLMDIRMPR